VLPLGASKGPAPPAESPGASVPALPSGKKETAPARGHYKVFISHAGEQKRGFVSFLHAELERRCEVPVFVDELSLQPGEHAWSNIVHALENAAVGAARLPMRSEAKLHAVMLAPQDAVDRVRDGVVIYNLLCECK
jgi:hypothetical protein